MKIQFVFLLSLLPIVSFSQVDQTTEVIPKVKMDSLYREDQFYCSFALNTLQNKPIGLSQDVFSSGFSLGFFRDFPVNKKRTLAFAPGIGFAFNNYNQNLKISESNQSKRYEIIDATVDYNRNRFTQLLVEVPFELRWRTSTFESHKFWRIYAGFKLGYLLYDESLYRDATEKIKIRNNSDFNPFQYGTYLAAGYNSINIFAYYGLNTLFKSAKTTTEVIEMNALNVGVLFYIL